MNRKNQRDDESLDDPDENDDDGVATDAMEASDQGSPWVPPSDPSPSGRESAQARAGFGATSDDELNDGTGAGHRGGDDRRSDEEITARVKRLLRTDAATSAMRLEVETIDGVVYLRGEIDTLDD